MFIYVLKKYDRPPSEKMGGENTPPLKTDLSKSPQNRPWLWTQIKGVSNDQIQDLWLSDEFYNKVLNIWLSNL